MDPFRALDRATEILLAEHELLTTAEREVAQAHIGRQIADDVCERHLEFCCPECFDVTVSYA